MDLKNTAALVTGGTKGIGAATAIALAKAGADVAINGRHDDDQAREVLAHIRDTGQRGELILGDCSIPEDCTRCVDETVARLGRLNSMVHCAGGLTSGGLFEVSPEAWMQAFDIHVHAVYHLTRAAIPHMRKEGAGGIVLISSTAGKLAIPTNIAYQVVKGSLPQFTRALAREMGPDNIRINCVAPGVIRTRFHDAMTPEQKALNLEHRIPLKREGTIDQVASLILEMLTNDYITGDTVTIDGGLTMRIA